MKANFSGYVLLELLIYITLMLFMALLFIFNLIQFYTTLNGCRQLTEKYLTLYAAHTLISTDLQKAPARSRYWKKLDTDEVIWHSKENDIGWSVHKNRLLRKEGKYYNNQWIQAHTSIIAYNIASLTIIPSFYSSEFIATLQVILCAQYTYQIVKVEKIIALNKREY